MEQSEPMRALHPNRIGANPVAVKSHELAERPGRLSNGLSPQAARKKWREYSGSGRNAAFGPAPEPPRYRAPLPSTGGVREPIPSPSQTADEANREGRQTV